MAAVRSALPFSRGHCTLRKGAPHTHFAFGKRIAPRALAVDTMAAQESLAGYIKRIRDVNNLTESRDEKLSGFRSLLVGGVQLGLITPDLAPKLVDPRHGGVFRETEGGIEIDPALKTCEDRTDAVAKVLRTLADEGALRGWRGELYPVLGRFDEAPCLLVERAAAAPLGLRAYGVHVNGFVAGGDGRERLWVARRSWNKPTWPGMLDHIVAGGQPYGISPTENVVKECGEEASIPLELARRAKPAGVVTYETLGPRGVGRDVLFVYDLELPEDFVPVPQDGEVEEFALMEIDEVKRIVRETREFKPNCNLVIIDFLVRHGHLSPELAGYLDLVRELRAGDCR